MKFRVLCKSVVMAKGSEHKRLYLLMYVKKQFNSVSGTGGVYYGWEDMRFVRVSYAGGARSESLVEAGWMVGLETT